MTPRDPLLRLVGTLVWLLAVSTTTGCVVTPALWNWATDDDIGAVKEKGVALATVPGERDRIFFVIKGMAGLEDGDYQVEVPVKLREDVYRTTVDNGLVLDWQATRWIESNTYHKGQLDRPLALLLVPSKDAEAHLSGSAGIASYLVNVRLAWDRGVDPTPTAYGYAVDLISEGDHVLSLYARNPAIDDDWVFLGQIGIGAGRPAPQSRRVAAVFLTPLSLVAEFVYMYVMIAGVAG